jgi:transcriptional regulator with XRE-family HTH domain
MSRSRPELEIEVGRQVRELRLRADRTQADVARAANVSVSALQALEHGAGSSMATFTAVVRALGHQGWLGTLAPPQPISPMARLREAKAAAAGRRTRASGTRARARAVPGP